MSAHFTKKGKKMAAIPSLSIQTPLQVHVTEPTETVEDPKAANQNCYFDVTITQPDSSGSGPPLIIRYQW